MRTLLEALAPYDHESHCPLCGGTGQLSYRADGGLGCIACASQPVCADRACLHPAALNIEGDLGRFCDHHWNPDADEMTPALSGYRR